ncbi:DUF6612 family protein [Alkalicoccus daliensis]|uniref:LPXTG-motif cell wall anchor domain-containing protein n=1 Tax=Alkalicoccus daliensis TaxID=745820 RepID=A0A1H0D503_9BACI|nr:DUF6612 family protein [Alkalicoccus daliensis]SDN65218.1 hypothetical protein SAMN04488053_102345 [Alkalicoccus daliensis]
MKKAVICMSAVALFAAPAAVSAESDAADILNQSNEAMDSLDSFSSTVYMEMSIVENGEAFTTEATVEQDVFLDPFKLRQETTTVLPELGEEETLMSYMTEDGFYQEDGEGGWIRLDDGLGDMMTAQDQLMDAGPIAEHMDVTEEDGYYVLTYTGEPEDFEDVMEAVYEMDGMNGDMEGMEEMEDMMNIEDISYEMHIDQDTYYVTDAVVDLTMSMEMEGMSVTMEQMMEMSFHNFNNVEDFDLPQEALEADDLEDVLEEELGDEMPATATSYPLWAGFGIALAAAGMFFMTGRRRGEVS